jgi:hypothetical protein
MKSDLTLSDTKEYHSVEIKILMWSFQVNSKLKVKIRQFTHISRLFEQLLII